MKSTRVRLLDEAEMLFARSSIAGVTTRQIVESAGQRNQSAISYHFGSREGLLLEILARRGGPVDGERGRLRSVLGEAPSVHQLVRCLVEPYCRLLDTAEGRSYLRIVAQLRGRFAVWRVESDTDTTKHLGAILDELERRPALPEPLCRERIVALIMVITATTAERARGLDDGVDPNLTAEDFVNDLVDICAAIVMAPVTTPGQHEPGSEQILGVGRHR